MQRAYSPHDIGPDEWRDAMTEARTRWSDWEARREAKARDFQIASPSRRAKAIVGWLSGDVGETDDQALGQGQVRDGAPSLEVLLVCCDAAGKWRTPRWLDEGRGGLPVPREVTPANDVAEVMASCVLRLPLTFSNAEAEEELWQTTPPAWESSPLIYRQPVLLVDEQGWGAINGRPVRYTPERGLEAFDSGE